jgi:hypothetical protein
MAQVSLIAVENVELLPKDEDFGHQREPGNEQGTEI